MTRCGSIALAGRPNVGKSSLMNAILGTPLSMVSPKAQATRRAVTGIHSTADTQLIFQDLPGLLDPEYLLHRSLRHLALEQLGKADLVCQLHPAPEAPAPRWETLVPDAPPLRRPPVLVYTKGDMVPAARRAELEAEGALVVSTSSPPSIDRLLQHLGTLVPGRPFAHDPADIGTQPVRFFVGEYLREAAFELLEEELPYSFTAEVDEFREDRSPVYIRATLYVERDSQKGIVIGKGGATLKQIGAHARRRLETLLGEPVYLETWVKVLPKWRKSRSALTRFGFPVPDDETR
jgi:GTPase